MIDRHHRRSGFLLLLMLVCAMTVFAQERQPARAEDSGIPGPFAESSLQFDFAKGLLGRGLYPEAIDTYDKFLKTFPRDPRVPLAILWRGEAYFGLHEYAQAAKDFYAFLTRYPKHEKNITARVRYGCCLFELKQYERAIAALEPLAGRRVKNNGVRQNVYYYLGLSRYALKQYAGALTALEKIERGPLAADALFARAEVLASQNKHIDAADAFAAFVRKFPGHKRTAKVLLRQGEELRIAGKLKESATCFSSLEKRGKVSPQIMAQARLGLAWVRYSQGDFAAARALALKVATAGKGAITDDASYLAGLASLRQGDPEAANAAFSKVKTGNYAEDALRKRAWALLAAGKTDKLLAVIREFAGKFPKAPQQELNYVAGKGLMKMGETKQAIRKFLQVRRAKAGYHKQAAYDLAFAYDTAGQYEQAAAAYAYFSRNFPDDAKLADALIGEGRALQRAKKYAAALPVYVRLFNAKSASDEIRELALGQQAVCYYWLKQYANMRKCYAQLLKQYPKGRSAGEAMYWLAWYDFSEKRFSKAAQRYGELIRLFPQHPRVSSARYRRAMSLFQAGETDKAATALYEIITKYPETGVDQREILWLGQHFMANNRLREAYAVYDLLLGRSPGREVRALAFYYQAEVKRRAHEWKAALAKYQRLLAEKETGLESAARFGLAVCLRHLGRNSEARKALSRVELSPTDPLVAHYHFELGLLDLAAKKYATAAENLMRVGLLYDNELLCGRALLAAYKACRLAKDARKAIICLDELAGTGKQTYGKRYPKSPYSMEAKRLLKAFAEGKGMLPAGKLPPPATAESKQ